MFTDLCEFSHVPLSSLLEKNFFCNQDIDMDVHLIHQRICRLKPNLALTTVKLT